MDSSALDAVIRGAQRGDPACLDALVDQFAGRIYGFLYRMTSSRADAEDLMQEVFVRLIRTLSSYRHEQRFEGWLFRIAANLARDRVRRAKRAPKIVSTDAGDRDASDLGPSDSSVDVDARLLHGEEMDALHRALAQLSETDREVIMLRHFSELSFKQIAKLTGVPIGTALARGHRALRRLRELMTGEAEPRGGRTAISA